MWRFHILPSWEKIVGGDVIFFVHGRMDVVKMSSFPTDVGRISALIVSTASFCISTLQRKVQKCLICTFVGHFRVRKVQKRLICTFL